MYETSHSELTYTVLLRLLAVIPTPDASHARAVAARQRARGGGRGGGRGGRGGTRRGAAAMPLRSFYHQYNHPGPALMQSLVQGLLLKIARREAAPGCAS